jgi:peptide-methionine (R)-S-oxide reductase
VTNSLDEKDVQWVSVDAAADADETFVDCRRRADVKAGTIPGAISVTQEDMMLAAMAGSGATVGLCADGQRLTDEFLPLLKKAEVRLVLFNADGGSTGREDDLLVMNILSNQLHVPLTRMARLRGGLHAWTSSGRPLQGPACKDCGPPPDGLAAFLTQAGLERLAPPLLDDAAEATTLEDLTALHADGRPKLLAALQQRGIAKLADRQAVANALGKALREGRLSTLLAGGAGGADAGAPRNKQTADEVWRAALTDFEYKVLRLKGSACLPLCPPNSKPSWVPCCSALMFRRSVSRCTAEPKGGEYDGFYPQPGEGYFACRGCAKPLYSAAAKFKSGCGWPAFDKCYAGSVECFADNAHGRQRIEITCAGCAGHLGHVFIGEHFTPTNERHCVNSVSVRFVKGGATTAEEEVVTQPLQRAMAANP